LQNRPIIQSLQRAATAAHLNLNSTFIPHSAIRSGLQIRIHPSSSIPTL